MTSRSAALAAALLALPSLGLARQGSPPPFSNVLVLLADDLGVDMVGAYGEGSDPPPTPNLDLLAASGVLFRNVWSNPLCSPSRAALQTGRIAHRTGIGGLVVPGTLALSPAEITIPEMLDLGTGGLYAHAAIGKWHLGNASVGGSLAPNVAGYDHYSGILGNFPPGQTYFSWQKVVDGVASTSSVYATTDQVDDAIAFMASAPPPWFCYVAFNAPHLPWHVPPQELFTVDVGAGNPHTTPGPLYKAAIEALDTEIGRLLASIPPAQVAFTTAIFLGDNGTPSAVIDPPIPSSHAKLTVYEGGVNVPLIVSGPPVTQPGSECGALVQITDLFATVADLAGVDLEAAMPFGHVLDSVSFHPLLVDPDAPSLRETVFTESFSPNGFDPVVERYAVRDLRYKLIARTVQPTLELYDLVNDPLELHDLCCGDLSPAAAYHFHDLLSALLEILPGGIGPKLEAEKVVP